MKTIIILVDGAADEPIAMLGNRTPLRVAHTPHMDILAQNGNSGLLHTIPHGFYPDSDIAHLSILGYNVAKCYQGRASIEAAGMGISTSHTQLILRCNLLTIKDNTIKNHAPEQLSPQEAKQLIDHLNSHLANSNMLFHFGESYRHLLSLQNGNANIHCTPPHYALGKNFRDVLPKVNDISATITAKTITELTLKSHTLLNNHPVNKQRIAMGKNPANSIWLWAAGHQTSLPPLSQMWGFSSGAIISAVNLVNGVGLLAGLTPITVTGATGHYNTNYRGKAQAALDALLHHDFVFLHIEACDEAGHQGEVIQKIKILEHIDEHVIAPIYHAIQHRKEAITMALLPDHATPCLRRTHTNAPIPFVIYRNNSIATPDSVLAFDEESAKNGNYGLISGKQFMQAIYHCHR